MKKRERRMNVEFWVNSFLQTMGGIYDEKVVKLFCFLIDKVDEIPPKKPQTLKNTKINLV